MTAEAVPLRAAGQVVVAAERAGDGPGQAEGCPLPAVQPGHGQGGGHRAGRHGLPFQQRDRLAAVVDPAPPARAARLGPGQAGVTEPGHGRGRRQPRGGPGGPHFPAFFPLEDGVADGEADGLGAGLGTVPGRTP